MCERGDEGMKGRKAGTGGIEFPSLNDSTPCWEVWNAAAEVWGTLGKECEGET